MRISIDHKTVYSYSSAVRHTAQYLRLTPPSNESQRVVSWTVEAPGKTARWRDVYGNRCLTLVIEGPMEEIPIRAYGQVDTVDLSGVLPVQEMEPPRDVFLRQTAITRPDPAIREFAKGYAEEISADRVAGLHKMMIGLRDRIDFQAYTTDVATTAAEAFSQGTGVCQDHTHMFLSACRYLGVPARYVGGYLYDGGNDEAYTAGHAWAAAFVEGLGWVSFDIANKQSGSHHYVGVAYGLDYADTAPIRGVRTGNAGDESMQVGIHVNLGEQ